MPMPGEPSPAPPSRTVYDLFRNDLGWALAVAEAGDDGERRLVLLSHADTGEEARLLRAARYPDAVQAPGIEPLPALRAQLTEYLQRRRRVFDVPLAPRGTAFQQRVWQQLQQIPFGQTRSYGEVAAAVDRPRGAQAVGQANGRNPLGVVVPCHRVVNADGTLGGYAGGLHRKRRLLELEGVRLPAA